MAPFWLPWGRLGRPFVSQGAPFGPLGAVLGRFWSLESRLLEPSGARRPPKVDPSCPRSRKIEKSDAFRFDFAIIFDSPCLVSWLPSAQISIRKASDLSATSARLKHDKTADNANVRLKGDKAAAIASSAAQGPLRQCRWISTGAR